MLGAVIATNVTPGAVIKQRCTRELVVGAGDWVARRVLVSTATVQATARLKQGNLGGDTSPHS